MASNSTPPKLNKQARAKLAKETINNVIPHILKSNKRAFDGANASELIRYSTVQESSKRTAAPAGESSASTPEAAQSLPPKVKVTVIQSDTYDAVAALIKSSNPGAKTAALNMASALQPGGGVLNGALAQEESLCVRSTLYPSLKGHYYRVPTTAAIYTPDVLVFRSADHRDLPKSEWFYTDVISVAALRHPETVMGPEGKLVYDVEQDKEAMVMKVRLIFQVARMKGITHLVLGALGCGAYKNPPEEVAKIFRKVIFGDRKRSGVEGVQEIVFAIFDDGENLRTFREMFKEECEEG